MKWRRNRRQHRRHGQRGNDARQHTPEIAVAVQPPPVPFQNVGRCVAAIQPTDDPLGDFRNRRQVDAYAHADQQNQHRTDITATNQQAIIRRRIDIALVEIVDQISRTCVNGGAEIGHKRRQQTGEQYAYQSRRKKIIDDVREDQLEIYQLAPRRHVFQHGRNKDQPQHGNAADQYPARHQTDRNDGAHQAGFSGIFRCEDALHIIIGR